MFRAITPPGKEKQLLFGLAKSVNSLAENPIWYHSILTTCNTSIVKLVNKVTHEGFHFSYAISCQDILQRLLLN